MDFESDMDYISQYLGITIEWWDSVDFHFESSDGNWWARGLWRRLSNRVSADGRRSWRDVDNLLEFLAYGWRLE